MDEDELAEVMAEEEQEGDNEVVNKRDPYAFGLGKKVRENYTRRLETAAGKLEHSEQGSDLVEFRLIFREMEGLIFW